jgi:Zn-dependent protease with chaperone function
MTHLDPAGSPVPPGFLLKAPEDSSPFKSFAGISPSRYRHPKDRSALEMVRSNGGIDELVHLFSEHLQERSMRVDNLASNLRISPRQLPGLHAICIECCERLGVEQDIEFFLGHGFNAWTSGVERPYVVIGHELLAAANTPDFIRFIIGHELGHVLSEHVHYHQVARWATTAASSLPMVGGLLKRGLDIALFDWYRAAEFTADRAGFLACQNFDSASRLLMIFAGFPAGLVHQFDLSECVHQEAAFRQESQLAVSKFIRFRSEVFMGHPWPIVRVAELSQWSDSDEYGRLLAEAHETVAASGNPFKAVLTNGTCAVCATAIHPGDRFCNNCGAPADRVEKGKRL